MTTIHEVQQVMVVETPFGESQVLFLIDYGIHLNTIWVCSSFSDGKVRHFDSKDITLKKNHTINFNMGEK